MTIKESLFEIAKDKLTPKYELAYYCEKDDTCPVLIEEFEVNSDKLEFILGNRIIFDDFKKIELALIGQDDECYNETCYNIKTLYIEEE